MKAAVVGAVVLAPLVLLAPVAVAVAAVGSAEASCSPSGAQAVDGQQAAGLDAPDEQMPNAKVIQTTGAAMKVPARGQVVALATALQESGLRNLTYGDRDSLGLFQQRPSQGWGSAEQIRDPAYASRRFYQGLMDVPGWQSMTLTQAAQAVQKSGFPDAYAKWEPLATDLQRALAGSGGRPVAGCEGGEQFGPIAAGAVPEGYEIPADAPKPVRTAIRWGLGQLGTPYQWGGTCKDAHGADPMGRCDCSSLMQAAYRAGDVSLTRTTYTQVGEGEAVDLDELRPGDLLFTRGTAAVPEHVGMFIGSGLILHAPRTGDVVKLSTLADWRPDVLAVRRVA